MSEPVDVVAEMQMVIGGSEINSRYVELVKIAYIEKWIAEVERLQALPQKARELHKPFPIYEECGHEGECPTESFEVDGDFWTCEEGFMYSVCSECCIVNDYQHEDCAAGHTHGKDIPICATVALLSNSQTGVQT